MDKGRHYSLLEESLPNHHSRSPPLLLILQPTVSAAEEAPINNIRTGNNDSKTEDFSTWSKCWVSSLAQLKVGPIFVLKSVYLSVRTGDGKFFTAVKRITSLQESENGTRP